MQFPNVPLPFQIRPVSWLNRESVLRDLRWGHCNGRWPHGRTLERRVPSSLLENVVISDSESVLCSDTRFIFFFFLLGFNGTKTPERRMQLDMRPALSFPQRCVYSRKLLGKEIRLMNEGPSASLILPSGLIGKTRRCLQGLVVGFMCINSLRVLQRVDARPD